jgi:hypothetical protein
VTGQLRDGAVVPTERLRRVCHESWPWPGDFDTVAPNPIADDRGTPTPLLHSHDQRHDGVDVDRAEDALMDALAKHPSDQASDRGGVLARRRRRPH